MTDAIKKAIEKSGQSLYRMEAGSGVNRNCIMRFMRDETSLRLDNADLLAAYFDLELTRKKR